MDPVITLAIIGAVVSLAGSAVALVGVFVTAYVALEVARLKANVREVHVAVNSERTVMTQKLESMARKIGASDEREQAAGDAATFEAGRAQGAQE